MTEHSTQTKNVHTCNSCKGDGVSYERELTCYHRGEYDHWTETCKTCNGSGLLITRTQTTVTTEPFVPLKEDRTKR